LSAARTDAARCRNVAFQSGWSDGSSSSAKTPVDHAVEQVVLVPHVLVERHRLDTEPLPELAHGQRPDAGLVRERDPGGDHPVTAQPRPVLLLLRQLRHVGSPMVDGAYGVRVQWVTP
jgi:hypothetical protein